MKRGICHVSTLMLWLAAPGLALLRNVFMQLMRMLLLALPLIIQTGCAWFGDEQTQRAEMIDTPQMAQTIAAARASLSAVHGWPQQEWWQAFADPALNRLITTALADNHDLKTATARLHQAQAQVDAQAARLYPTVDANVSFSAQRFSANSTQAKLAGEHFRQLLINPLVLRYHLDLWGRDKAELAAAVGAALADDAQLAYTRLLLAAAVARNYFELAAAQEKLQLAEKLVACRRSLLQLSEVLLQTGLVPNVSVLQMRVELNVALQREVDVHTEIKLLRDLLATLTGNGPDWGLTLNIEHSVVPDRISLPSDLRLHLLARRPDVVAAKLRVEAAAQQIEAAKAAFYPDVNLIGFAGLHSVSMSDVLLQGSSLAYAVGPSIDFPLFEGGRLRAGLSEQQAIYDAAVETYNSRVLGAVQEVADALAVASEVDAKRNLQQQMVAAAVESGKLSDVLNSNGLNDRGAAIAERVIEYEQRFRFAALQSEYFKSVVNLFAALGGGYITTNRPVTSVHARKDPS